MQTEHKKPANYISRRFAILDPSETVLRSFLKQKVTLHQLNFSMGKNTCTYFHGKIARFLAHISRSKPAPHLKSEFLRKSLKSIRASEYAQ